MNVLLLTLHVSAPHFGNQALQVIATETTQNVSFGKLFLSTDLDHLCGEGVSLYL